MPRDDPDRQPFYLIVADYDRSVFAVEARCRTTGRGSLPLGRPAAVSARSLAVRPGLTATSWQPSFAVNTGSPASRPAAS
jgi:hypothetical protein